MIFNPSKTPNSKEELVMLIRSIMTVYGNNCDLNTIDVSHITDMSDLFSGSLIKDFPYTLHTFNGDISKWDVSNVSNMDRMFEDSSFDGDISRWNVSNVTSMSSMFKNSNFNGDLSRWNVGKVKNMNRMFQNSKFTGDISRWDISNVKSMNHMFYESKFNGDLYKWDISRVVSRHFMLTPTFSGVKPCTVSPSSRRGVPPMKLLLYYNDDDFIWSFEHLDVDPSYKMNVIQLDGHTTHTVEHYARFINMDYSYSTLPNRVKNCMCSNNICMSELIFLTCLGHLYKFRNIGPKSSREICEYLKVNGFLIDLKGRDRWKSHDKNN